MDAQVCTAVDASRTWRTCSKFASHRQETSVTAKIVANFCKLWLSAFDFSTATTSSEESLYASATRLRASLKLSEEIRIFLWNSSKMGRKRERPKPEIRTKSQRTSIPTRLMLICKMKLHRFVQLRRVQRHGRGACDLHRRFYFWI